jgi:hypothetical protein
MTENHTLIDASGNFEVLNFAVREQPIFRMTNLTNEDASIALYLQRHDTREVVFIDVPLTSLSILSTLATLSGKANPEYDDDYWVIRLFSSQSTSITKIESTSTNDKSFDGRTYTVEAWCGQWCTLVMEMDFFTSIVEHPESLRFDSYVEITRQSTTCRDTHPQGQLNNCANHNVLANHLAIGSKLQPIKVELATSGTDDGGEFLYSANFSFQNVHKFEKSGFNPEIYLNFGLAVLKTPLSINLASTFMPENKTVGEAAPTVTEFIFDNIDKSVSPPRRDPAKQVMHTEYVYTGISLDDVDEVTHIGHSVRASYLVSDWGGGSPRTSYTGVQWHLPLHIAGYEDTVYTYISTIEKSFSMPK